MDIRIRGFVLAAAMTAGALAAAPGEDYATRDIFTDGEFFVGCNYWARNAGMYMWSDWRPDVVERELAELSKYGVRVMRVFPLWSDFQPLTGNCPYVCFTEHPKGDGRAIVMAINYEPRPIECPISVSGRITEVWRGKVTETTVSLEPNEAALFEVECKEGKR